MSDRKEARQLEIPTVELLEGELKRTKYNRRYLRTLRSTVFSLVLVVVLAYTGVAFSGFVPGGERHLYDNTNRLRMMK